MIRAARPEDTAALAALLGENNALHARLLPAIFREPPHGPEAFLAASLEDPNRALLVAEVGGEVVGMVLVEVMPPGPLPILVPCTRGYVHELTVRDDLHRRGVGRELMAAADGWSRERGATVMELNVFIANAGALSFYEALGYTPSYVRMRRDL